MSDFDIYMKKAAVLFVTFISLIQSFNLAAQEKSDISSSLMLLYSPFDGSRKVASETTAIGKDHVGYAYAELVGFSGGGAEAYGQFFWEQKFWEKPLFMHAEHRGVATGGFYESTTYLGAAYCIYSNHGFLALEPLAMWNQRLGFGAQFSMVGGWEWEHFMVEHYTDIWKTHKMNSPVDLYSQTRLFVKVYKRLYAGVIGTVYYSPENIISEGVYLSLRWRL